MPPVIPPEFSRRVRIDDLPPAGRAITAEASESERRALAHRLGLAGLARLHLEGEVSAIRGGTVVRLEARFAADVTQTCVVTLVPLDRHIEADFVRLYAAEAPPEAGPDEEIFFDELGEDIEPLTGNQIDAGEAAAEQLALELDPYPRAPGASLAPVAGTVGDAGLGDEDGEDDVRHPFAELAALAEERKRKDRK
ncbi:MAG: DUF177 domain-containing protein [Rhodospirillales bacterium]|jgi:hypothetical protein|nr:DUF177 domain-containing protein [Rhodospirillales bacterium]